VGADITGAAQWVAGRGDSQITLGFKAQNESDNFGWKKFNSAEVGSYVPAINVVYNAPPNVPSAQKVSPSAWCGSCNGYWASSLTPTLSVTASDPDGGMVDTKFEVAAGGGASLWTSGILAVQSGSSVSVKVPAGILKDGQVYMWRAFSGDGRLSSAWTGFQWFGVDVTKPAAPAVSSTDYPADGAWHGDAGVKGAFTYSMKIADSSVVNYYMDVDVPYEPTELWKVPVVGGASGIGYHPPATVGRHTMQVVAVDRAGNRSPVTKYNFLVGRAGLVSPEPDSRVVRRARVEVGWNTGALEGQFTHVRYEWRKGPDDTAIKAVDPGALTSSTGQALSWSGSGASAWAKAPVLGGYVNWDAVTTLGNSGGPVQVRAVVAKDAAGAGAATTQWVSIVVDPDAAGAASDQVGPGSVNLLTGDYSMSATDVSEFGLDLVRATSSRDTDAGYELQAEQLTDAQAKATSANGFSTPTATVTIDTTRFREGTSSFKILPIGSGSDTYATGFAGDVGAMRAGLKAGGTYRVSGWVYVPAASGLAPASGCGYSLALFTRSGAGAYSNPCTSGQKTPKPTKTDTWQQVSMDVTIPAGTTEAFIRMYNGNTGGSGKAVYFDDLSVKQIWAPFGKQWSSGTTDWAAGTAYTRVTTPEEGLAAVELTGGGQVWFSEGGGKWWPQPGAEDLTLSKVDASTWSLTEIDGTVTVFTQQVAGAGWPVVSSAPPAAAGQSRHIYTPVNGVQRLTRVIAPIEPGIDGWVNQTTGNLQACTSATPARGCEVMDLDYATTTTATKDAAGVFAGQVSQASVWTWNGTAMVKVPVAAYRYDDQGRLTQVWDPRIDPAQKTTYTYDGEGRVTQVTPSGEVPYTFTYGKAGATVTGSGDLIDNSAGRILGVNRASLVPGSKDELGPVNTTSVVYNVPLTRDAGGPYDLQGATLAKWAQSDGPTDATAIYGPEDNPGLNTATATAPGKDGYMPAVVHYLNSSGREVNTAAPAGKQTPVDGFIDTTEYDRYGNTVRTLDATNRLLALGTLPGAEGMLTELGLTGRSSAELSNLLDSRSTYGLDGLDLITTTGPVQRLAVANDPNDVRLLRPRSVNVYDQGNPQGAAAHLVTTTTEGGIDPFTANTANPVADTLVDPVVTVNDYNPIDGKSPLDPTSGWVHKQPTRVTADAGQATALTSSVLYDGRGRVLESRKPGSSGADAGTTKTTYYTPDGTGDCAGRPEWAGQPCVVSAGGAITGFDGSRMSSSLTVKRTEAYNGFGSPTVVSESVTGPVNGVASTVTRKSVTTYDGADRVCRCRRS
jgi:YD repeat-containing protein